MSARRILVAIGAGSALGLLVTVLVAAGAIVLAVSGERSVEVPLLVGAVSGSGADLLELEVNPVGTLVWILGLSVLFAVPVALARRNVGAAP